MNGCTLPLIGTAYQVNTVRMAVPDPNWFQFLKADPRRWYLAINTYNSGNFQLWPGSCPPDTTAFWWPINNTVPYVEITFQYQPGLIGLDWWIQCSGQLEVSYWEILYVG